MDIPRRKKEPARQAMRRTILAYGSDVLHSPVFLASFSQRHHFHTSVGKHSLQVAAWTVRICRALERRGIAVDEGLAVRAALCHDLGLVGRDTKYKNNPECSRRHPIESAKLARTIYPDMDERMENAILRHMFPLALLPPSSWEGLAVSLADKVASVTDVLAGVSHKPVFPKKYILFKKAPSSGEAVWQNKEG